MLAMMTHGVPWDVARKTDVRFGIRLLRTQMEQLAASDVRIVGKKRIALGNIPVDSDVPGVKHLTAKELGREIARYQKEAKRGG